MRPRTLAQTGAAVAVTAVAGGAAAGGDSAWYRSLRKPPFQPPPAAFPVVWTGLYAGIAVASAEVLDAARGRERRDFVAALGTNLALNASWTWCFFRLRRPGLATAQSALLTVSTADLARRAQAVSPRAHALLALYLAWTAFATVLAGSIARLNRR